MKTPGRAIARTVTGIMVVLLVMTAGSLVYAGTATSRTNTTTQTVTTSTKTLPTVVNLDVVADWGGATYDAFVIPTSANGTLPTPATGGKGPGPNNNNVTVAAGVPITFVISNLDTATFNFSSTVTVPFTVYNDTAAGYVTVRYSTGQSVKLLASHTFTISELGINVPTPPDTIVSFTYTFAKAGIYRYFCLTPCGPGMSVPGYMIGYVIVK